MELLKTDIVGYDTILPFLESRIKQPTHIALFGSYGSGKTTLARQFVQSYFAAHDITINTAYSHPDYLMILSAEQDRGIHTVRDSLMDFVRQPATRPGLVRWVIIDDIDTFPELSQQALRRPMEMYRHVCCFCFIGTKQAQLISPIISRCQNIDLPFFDINQYGWDILKNKGVDITKISKSSYMWLCASAYGNIADFAHRAQLLALAQSVEEKVTDKDILEICSVPPYQDFQPFLHSLHGDNIISQITHCIDVWQLGYSYEDILEAIREMITLFGIINPEYAKDYYEWLTYAWSQYCDGRTSLLSLLSSFQLKKIGISAM